MPQGAYDGLDGRQITQKVRESIARSGVTMSVMTDYDHLPIEHRQRVRQDETRNARQALADGRQALAAWAEKQTAEAKRILASRPVGSPAEESRRVADELRITRMVDASRARGSAKADAEDLAERASNAYGDGSIDEADVLARASVELGGDRANLAQEVLASVQTDRDLADPVRARALRMLGDTEVVLAAFERDASATYSQTLRDAAALAKVTGEQVSGLREEGARASLTAKVVGAIGAQKFGGTYAEPVGALPGAPTDTSHPDGAKLPARS